MKAKLIKGRASIAEILGKYSHLNDVTLTRAPSLRPFWLDAYLAAYNPSDVYGIEVEALEHPSSALLVLCGTNRKAQSVYRQTADYWDLFQGGPVSHSGLRYILEAALRELKKDGIAELYLQGLPDLSPIRTAFPSAASKTGFKFQECPDEWLPFIKIQPDTVTSWSGINKSIVAEYEHKISALSKHNRLSFVINPCVDQRTWLLKEARIAHIARWAQRGIRSKWADPQRAEFIDGLIGRAGANNSLRLYGLLIDGEFASMRLAFSGGTSVYEWATTFSGRYRKYSPGGLLMLLTLEHCKDSGEVDTYELLRGREVWKLDWTNSIRRSYAIRIVG